MYGIPNDTWSQYTNVAMDLVEKITNHPFEKPRSLIQRLLLNHSNESMLVFDPFAGSGTLGDVCDRNNRDYYLIEKDLEKFEFTKERSKQWRSNEHV